MLTDDDIARMEPDERRDLIARLARPLDDVVDNPARLRTQRRLRIGLAAAAAVLLIPWTVYLAISLPREHKVRDWGPLWVGFDGIELLLLAITFWLSRQRRTIGLLVAFATGVVLLCDAWFDLLTSAPGDLWQAVALGRRRRDPVGGAAHVGRGPRPARGVGAAVVLRPRRPQLGDPAPSA